MASEKNPKCGVIKELLLIAVANVLSNILFCDISPCNHAKSSVKFVTPKYLTWLCFLNIKEKWPECSKWGGAEQMKEKDTRGRE